MGFDPIYFRRLEGMSAMPSERNKDPLREARYTLAVRRRMLNLAAAVSLILMLAVAGLWVRSYWRCDHIDRVGVHPEQNYACGDMYSSRVGMLQRQRQVMTMAMGHVAGESKWSLRVDEPG